MKEVAGKEPYKFTKKSKDRSDGDLPVKLLTAPSTEESLFSELLPAIRKFVRRDANNICRADVEDIEGKVGLKILQKLRTSSTIINDWFAYTKKVVQSEKADYYNERAKLAETSLEHEKVQIEVENKFAEELKQKMEAAIGSNENEWASRIWQIIQKRTLLEKQAFLLKNFVIIECLISCEIVNETEMAQELEISLEQFLEITKKESLTASEIAREISQNDKQYTAKQVIEARWRATSHITSVYLNHKQN